MQNVTGNIIAFKQVYVGGNVVRWESLEIATDKQGCISIGMVFPLYFYNL